MRECVLRVGADKISFKASKLIWFCLPSKLSLKETVSNHLAQRHYTQLRLEIKRVRKDVKPKEQKGNQT